MTAYGTRRAEKVALFLAAVALPATLALDAGMTPAPSEHHLPREMTP